MPKSNFEKGVDLIGEKLWVFQEAFVEKQSMSQAINDCEKMTQANYKIMADPYKMVPDYSEIDLDLSITNLNRSGINLDH